MKFSGVGSGCEGGTDISLIVCDNNISLSASTKGIEKYALICTHHNIMHS